MLITYFIFLFLGVFFKVMHWPGASIILLISILFPLIDIIVQAIRKKGDRETNVLSAIGLLFLSLFLVFKFQHWPGGNPMFFIATLILGIYFFRFISKKLKFNFRFILITLIFLFGAFNFMLKGSSFRLTYLTQDPFNPNEPIPTFVIQSLAYDFYREGDFDKAAQLIERNINHLEELIEEDNVPDYVHKMDEYNLELSQSILQQIESRTWSAYIPLFPEDRHLN